MIWLLFVGFLVLLSGMFLGGLCHGAGVADREWERLELEQKAKR